MELLVSYKKLKFLLEPFKTESGELMRPIIGKRNSDLRYCLMKEYGRRAVGIVSLNRGDEDLMLMVPVY